jgi:hypothetical protein
LASEVAGYAKFAEAAYRPSVTLSSADASGKKTLVKGTVSDANGVSLLKVNGHVVRVSSSGKWRAKLPLRKRANKIIAVATNVFGNSTTATVRLPVISKVHQSHRRWRERGRRAGTTFKFRLNERARVKLVFMRRRGRRLIRAGTLTFNGHRGLNRRHFRGRVRRRRLKPGRYTVTITAISNRLTSHPVKLMFTVLG